MRQCNIVVSLPPFRIDQPDPTRGRPDAFESTNIKDSFWELFLFGSVSHLVAVMIGITPAIPGTQ
jgi:hypothetical protein